MSAEWQMATGMVMTATLVALAALALLLVWQTMRPVRRPGLFDPTPSRIAFLFDGERLVDASPTARALLPEGEDDRAWPRLLARFGPEFPQLAERVASLPRLGQLRLQSLPGRPSPMVMTGEYLSGLVRLTICNGQDQPDPGHGDVAATAALQEEVLAQRSILTHAPVLMWKEAADGSVVWANGAYVIRAVELLPGGKELSWPLPGLFAPAEMQKCRPPRAKLQMPGGTEWFDLVRVPSGSETLCYALTADKAVRAETALREFMQTLTKTFADLPIGLAIFDRSRALQMFNPALTDLTTLAPEFLISRPTLNSFLDAMRSKAMIPEPKNYRSWRNQLARLEEEATKGIFEETWSLPGGQTYRVVGRPHPNGALAFMFEDISTEMSRTRRYRADLELGQSVIDSVEEAVAVFAQGGQLVMSNHAYSQLWKHDPQVLLSEASITTLCAWWRDRAAPAMLWEDIADYVSSAGDRAPWHGEIRLLDGRLVTCRLRPLTAGATLITFRIVTALPVAPVRLAEAPDQLLA